jgi:hypothetical protein
VCPIKSQWVTNEIAIYVFAQHVSQAYQCLGLRSLVMRHCQHLNEALIVRLNAVDIFNDYLWQFN